MTLPSGSTLTVLAYHRITDPYSSDFVGLKSTVSGTPAQFSHQMDYIARHFNVISIATLHGWLKGEKELPTWPALITFDDGYRDNWEAAVPILCERNLTAVFYLTTGHIESSLPFYWDLAAFCFSRSEVSEAELPLMGRVHWTNVQERDQTQKQWLGILKRVPEEKKQHALAGLPSALRVEVNPDSFAGLTLSWNQVRAMRRVGMTLGAHTQTHPVMTNIPAHQAETEARNSKTRIEEETGQPVTTFAYPFGHRIDFNEEVQQRLAHLNFQTAFSLQPGPSSHRELKRAPLAIRRTLISHKDTINRFKLKVRFGVPRLLEHLRRTG